MRAGVLRLAMLGGKKLVQAAKHRKGLAVFRRALGHVVPGGFDALESGALVGVGRIVPVAAVHLGQEAGFRVVSHAPSP
jgi:hypothetical protein